LWWGSDGLFFKVPPLASEVLITIHPLLENVLHTVDHFEISCLRAPFSWLEKPRNGMGARSGLYGRCSNEVPPTHFSKLNKEFNSDLVPYNFWAFPTMKREL
jgi:hypothetical protein